MNTQQYITLVNKDRTSVSSHTVCCVLGCSLEMFNQTPMSTLIPTPITPISASTYCHLPHKWLRYPVAIAGHVVRSHSSGTGFFKLQLQCVVGLSSVLSLVGHWSCNLKEKLNCFFDKSFYRTPMTMLLSPLHWQHRHIQQHPAAYSLPVASAGYNLPTLSSRVGSFKWAFRVVSIYKRLNSSPGSKNSSGSQRNPDDDVAFASSLATSTHTAAPRCLFPSSSKCWIQSADPIL